MQPIDRNCQVICSKRTWRRKNLAGRASSCKANARRLRVDYFLGGFPDFVDALLWFDCGIRPSIQEKSCEVQLGDCGRHDCAGF